MRDIGLVDSRMFPALVGMNREASNIAADEGYVPRTRGDEPATLGVMARNIRCSPHSWG